MSEVHVKGLSELHKFLQELPVKVEKNVLRGAMRAGAKVIEKEAKRLAPSAPPNSRNRKRYGLKAGALRDSIRVSVRTQRGRVVAKITAGGGDVFYATMVEFGTAAHFISVRKEVRPSRMTRRGLRVWSIRTINKAVKSGSLVIGKNFVGDSVHHPGAKKRPFMRPALDAKMGDAVMAAGEYMKKRLATKHGLTQAENIELEMA